LNQRASLISVGGIFYGWPALQFVLKEENVFSELCENSNSTASSNFSRHVDSPRQLIAFTNIIPAFLFLEPS
jgi:hypothetical protein